MKIADHSGTVAKDTTILPDREQEEPDDMSFAHEACALITQRRLLGRRRANGRIETKLPEKTYATLLRTRDRARKVWEYSQHDYLSTSDTSRKPAERDR